MKAAIVSSYLLLAIPAAFAWAQEPAHDGQRQAANLLSGKSSGTAFGAPVHTLQVLRSPDPGDAHKQAANLLNRPVPSAVTRETTAEPARFFATAEADGHERARELLDHADWEPTPGDLFATGGELAELDR